MSATRTHRFSFNDDEFAMILMGLDELEIQTANKVCPEALALDPQRFQENALMVSAIKRLRERLKS